LEVFTPGVHHKRAQKKKKLMYSSLFVGANNQYEAEIAEARKKFQKGQTKEFAGHTQNV
jgi:hypothetical protein